jgi:hypothetical protein
MNPDPTLPFAFSLLGGRRAAGSSVLVHHRYEYIVEKLRIRSSQKRATFHCAWFHESQNIGDPDRIRS